MSDSMRAKAKSQWPSDVYHRQAYVDYPVAYVDYPMAYVDYLVTYVRSLVSSHLTLPTRCSALIPVVSALSYILPT